MENLKNQCTNCGTLLNDVSKLHSEKIFNFFNEETLIKLTGYKKIKGGIIESVLNKKEFLIKNQEKFSELDIKNLGSGKYAEVIAYQLCCIYGISD